MPSYFPPFNCIVCGRFVGQDGYIAPPRYLFSADYWNGSDEVIDAYCRDHLPNQKEPFPCPSPPPTSTTS